MKKYIYVCSILTAVCSFSMVSAATPQETYNALLDSYANMPSLNMTHFPIEGQKGSIMLSLGSGAANSFSMRIAYDGVTHTAAKQAKVSMSFKGQGIIDGDKTAVNAGISVILDSGNVYAQISSFSVATMGSSQAEAMMITTMVNKNLLGKWILLSPSDLSDTSDLSPITLKNAGSNTHEMVQKLLAIFRTDKSHIIEAWMPGGNYSFSFTKDLIKQIGALIGVPISSEDLVGFNVHGSINTDAVNPQLTLTKSRLDETTRLNAVWNKDTIALHMTDLMSNMSIYFAKKQNGFGLSYVDDQKNTFDMSYALSPAQGQIVRAKAMMDGLMNIRLSVIGKYYDAANQQIIIPTQNIIPVEKILDSMSVMEMGMSE